MSVENPQLARFRADLAYERTAHEQTLRSLASIPDDGRKDPDYRRAADLLAHVLQSRMLWLARFDGAQDRAEDWFPSGQDEEELAARIGTVDDAWERRLAELDDEGLEHAFEYTSWEGDAYANTVADVLVQLRGHSFYHRGQIAQLVRRLGGRPAVAEYVLHTRRRV